MSICIHGLCVGGLGGEEEDERESMCVCCIHVCEYARMFVDVGLVCMCV